MTIKTILLTLTSVFLATAGQLMLKSGMARVGYIGTQRLGKPLQVIWDVARTWQVLIGLTLFVLSAVTWLVVISRVPLSLAYPFAGITYVLLAMFSKFVLKEHVPYLRWVGVALIVAGVVMVGRTSGPEQDALDQTSQQAVPPATAH
ncbi:MAG TPA: EamA family transporter [Actinomycetota bacterium]|nr:EamA family transporter [Actinomycetota bacterium]